MEQLGSWKDIGVKAVDVWPAAKLEDLIAGQEEIRRNFSAWITPGDILNSIIEKIDASDINFEQTIRQALQRSLRKDQFARLRDAGDVADPQIKTSQIFVDLPIISTSEYSQEVNSKFVARLTERAKEKFSKDLEKEIYEPDLGNQPARNKIVILGGPGQGKSTGSMFAAQLFRACFLYNWANSHDAPTFKLINEILARAKSQKIPGSFAKRFPIYVSLPRFADAISAAREKKKNTPSLLQQITDELSLIADINLDKMNLRRWLKLYPWIIIFDGLDEVPSSGERTAIVEAVYDFEGEITVLDADVLMIITTRPQGYNDDFPKNNWEHWALADLSPQEAIDYGEALGRARYPDDSYRRDDLLRSLKAATTKPAISRLMVSPLQVTIMHMIVDTGGSIPNARWSLFNEYFEILRKREKAKGGDNQKIIERNWTILGPIHQRAGLILQTDSEHAGAAQSFLSEQRLLQIIKGYLLEEGHDIAEIEARSVELVQVALHRLVLLAARDEGRITFDVRSLQEFMAAGALTAGLSEHVLPRLRLIAKTSHWRHVFLIAASRCFSEDVLHHLRTPVVSIAREIEIDGSDLMVRTGARLAIAMFVDGVGIDHPVSRKMLAHHALELLNCGTQKFDTRLLLIFEPTTKATASEFLRKYLCSTNISNAIPGWTLLLKLAANNPEDFADLLLAVTPSNSDYLINLLHVLPLPLPDAINPTELTQILGEGNPENRMFSHFSQNLFNFIESDALKGLSDITRKKYEAMSELIRPWNRSKSEITCSVYVEELETGLKFVLQGVEAYRGWLANTATLPTLGKGWAAVSWTARFCQNPGSVGLAASLRELDLGLGLKAAKQISTILPWPLSAFISTITDDRDIAEYAKNIDAGEYGSSKDWADAQTRWRTSGAPLSDIDSGLTRIPFSDLIGEIGLPIFGSNMRITHNNINNKKLINQLINKFNNPDFSEDIRTRISQLVLFTTVGSGANSISSGPDLEIFLTSLIKSPPQTSYSTLFFIFDKSVWENDAYVIQLSNYAKFPQRLPHKMMDFEVTPIINAFIRTRLKTLLIPICIGLCYSNTQAAQSFKSSLEPYLTYESDDTAEISVAINILRIFLELPNKSLFDLESLGRSSLDLTVQLLVQLAKIEAYITQISEIAPRILNRVTLPVDESYEALHLILTRALDARESGIVERNVWHNVLNLSENTFKILQLN